jgi:protein-tyrosine phosphatase
VARVLMASRNTRPFPFICDACDACYEEAFRLDMTVARVRKWEEPDHIVDGIWIGGEGSTMDTLWLMKHHIRHVLTVAAHTKIENKHQNIQYLQIHVDDDTTEDLRRYWDTPFDFIDQADNNVLVLCVSGISRSGATVTAYVMTKRGLSNQDALELIRQKRPQVSPNGGFQQQLRLYEEELASLQSANHEKSVDMTEFIHHRLPYCIF